MIFLISCLILLVVPLSVKAVCPICTVTVCVGVGLSRWIGVDDAITGLWIGALNIPLIIWTIDWLNKKNIRFFCRKLLIIFIYYLAIFLPLYQFNLINIRYNKLWGFDKLLLGIIIGSIVFLINVLLYEYLKKKNNNKAYFPFQKIIMPIGSLIILSFLFYATC
ncbi:MAG: hypothetical protein AAB653_03330 [Patescibacteria group bacterium]